MKRTDNINCSMKWEKRLRVFFSIIICLLIQVVSVYPHHHHFNIFCLQADYDICTVNVNNSDCTHSTDNKDRNSCSYGCITVFHFATSHFSQHHLTPDYSFYRVLYYH